MLVYRSVTYPTVGKGKSSTQMCPLLICDRSQEGNQSSSFSERSIIHALSLSQGAVIPLISSLVSSLFRLSKTHDVTIPVLGLLNLIGFGITTWGSEWCSHYFILITSWPMIQVQSSSMSSLGSIWTCFPLLQLCGKPGKLNCLF